MKASQKLFLLHKDGNDFKRHFHALEDNVVVMLLLGAVVEACILERRTEDLRFFQHYVSELRKRFREKKYYGLEIIESQAFEE